LFLKKIEKEKKKKMPKTKASHDKGLGVGSSFVFLVWTS
jgi:hypothetical protein